jgi:hypothetical protein
MPLIFVLPYLITDTQKSVKKEKTVWTCPPYQHDPQAQKT